MTRKAALLLVVAGLCGCHSTEGTRARAASSAASGTAAPTAASAAGSAGARGTSASSASSNTSAPDAASASRGAVPLSRCRALPPDTRPPNPDFPSLRNPDHTLKRLPPGPPGHPGTTVLFRYFDFGPQSVHNGLLGHEWWSWEAGGSFEPGDVFDVRVVVYQKRTKKKVAAEYPTVRGKSDYRLIDRKAALAYLARAGLTSCRSAATSRASSSEAA